MDKLSNAIIIAAAATRFDALQGADDHFIQQGRTAAALLEALRGADPWLVAAIAVLCEESHPGRGYDRQRGEAARGILEEISWGCARIAGTSGRVKVARDGSFGAWWILLDGATALSGGWGWSQAWTPVQRRKAKDERKATTKAAAAAYTAARLRVEGVLTGMTRRERGHLAEWLCLPWPVTQPTSFGGWEAEWGQEGGTFRKVGLPYVAALPALRRASKAVGSSMEADLAAFEMVENRRKAAEGRKIARLFRQLAEAAWTASCLQREAEALASVSRLRAIHA
jgi:hypothetical protein